MSSEDGPGLRTTAFLKGCSLRCTWCHNPESIAMQGEVLWHGERCMDCASCIAVCPQEGISRQPEFLMINREICKACFSCVDACPTAALEGKGYPITAEELARELVRDVAYWGEDGGVTVSGGEALLQEDTIFLLALLREKGVQTAIDTCGMVSEDRLRQALLYTDIVLYDLKLADTTQHRKHTGAGNEQILENLALVARWAEERTKLLWIRTPVIPGATDTDENILGITQILAPFANSIDRWELCAFNNLGASKYKSIQQTWHYADASLIQKKRMQELVSRAQSSCPALDIRATGSQSE